MTSASYPRPEIPYRGYSDLYFAIPWQVHSHLVIAGYDRGELTMELRRVRFTGMRVYVDCQNVSSIRLIRKAFPLGTVSIVSAIAIAVVAVSDFRTQPHAFGLVAALLVGLSIIQVNERWIEIGYSPTPGQDAQAYFRRRPIAGLANSRTRALYRELNKIVLGGGDDPSRTKL